jgi:5'(3')-deoxyribonucleotidase
MISNIYLDMDEVLVDTTYNVMKYHNLPNFYRDPKNHGIYYIHHLAKMKHEEMWHVLDADFWANLPKMPWANQMIETACKIVGANNVYILSAPIESAGCCFGKQQWIRKHFPFLSPNLILTCAKHAAIAKNSMLFDDSENNEAAFKEKDIMDSFYLIPSLNNRKANKFNELFNKPILIDEIMWRAVLGELND